jgi:hypothetical protein
VPYLDPKSAQHFIVPFQGFVLFVFYVAVAVTVFDVNGEIANGGYAGELTVGMLVAALRVVFVCRDKLVVAFIPISLKSFFS